MNGYSFYGGRTGAPFEIVKVYPNLTELLDNLNKNSDVQYDEYVRVDYTLGEQNNYNKNASIDLNINRELKPSGYETVTNWNNSIWQKTIDGPKFIVNLSSNTPNFEVINTDNPLAPSEKPVVTLTGGNTDNPQLTFGIPRAAKIFTGEETPKKVDSMLEGDYYITSNGVMYQYINKENEEDFKYQGVIINAPDENVKINDSGLATAKIKEDNSGWELSIPSPSQWYIGNGEPDNSTGVINDFYLDKNNGNTYKKQKVGDENKWLPADGGVTPPRLIGAEAQLSVIEKNIWKRTSSELVLLSGTGKTIEKSFETIEDCLIEISDYYNLNRAQMINNELILVSLEFDDNQYFYYFYNIGNSINSNFVWAKVSDNLNIVEDYKLSDQNDKYTYSTDYLNGKLIKIFDLTKENVDIPEENELDNDLYTYYAKVKINIYNQTYVDQVEYSYNKLLPYIGYKEVPVEGEDVKCRKYIFRATETEQDMRQFEAVFNSSENQWEKYFTYEKDPNGSTGESEYNYTNDGLNCEVSENYMQYNFQFRNIDLTSGIKSSKWQESLNVGDLIKLEAFNIVIKNSGIDLENLNRLFYTIKVLDENNNLKGKIDEDSYYMYCEGDKIVLDAEYYLIKEDSTLTGEIDFSASCLITFSVQKINIFLEQDIYYNKLANYNQVYQANDPDIYSKIIEANEQNKKVIIQTEDNEIYNQINSNLFVQYIPVMVDAQKNKFEWQGKLVNYNINNEGNLGFGDPVSIDIITSREEYLDKWDLGNNNKYKANLTKSCYSIPKISYNSVLGNNEALELWQQVISADYENNIIYLQFKEGNNLGSSIDLPLIVNYLG